MNNKILKTPVDVEKRRTMDLRSGDTIRVWQKIEEGKDKEGKMKFRLQAFEGLIIARKHGTEAGGTFTVRRVTGGTGVEKTYPLYSPMIDSIETIKRARVRRAKLYFIREKVSREARRQLRRTRMMGSNVAVTEEGEIKTTAKAEEQVAA